MKKANEKESSVVVKVSGPFVVPRRFTIEQLAQYLGITNFEAEERLRHGDIKFKWAGCKGKGHKVVEKTDADRWRIVSRMPPLNENRYRPESRSR